MPIAIFWTDVTANMAACEQAGRRGEGVRRAVAAARHGLPARLEAKIRAFGPDAMLVLGWRLRKLVAPSSGR